MEQATFLKINPADSVVVCLSPKKKGDIIAVDGKQITLNQDTPAGHKVLITDVKEGEDIIKYGYPIGHARQDMKAGDWVNENNLKTNLSGTLEYTYQPVGAWEGSMFNVHRSTFKGYVRKNGDVGVRNEIWIVPTVGCVNGIAENLAHRLMMETGGRDVDAIWTWHHNYGCSQLSEDHENTRKVLRDICLHPNAGGVLVLSLGCENNQPEDFMAMLGDYDKSRIKLLVTQRVEGDEIEAGMAILRELYAQAARDKRRLARGPGRHQRAHRGSRDVRCRNHPHEPLRDPRTVPADSLDDQQFQELFPFPRRTRRRESLTRQQGRRHLHPRG